MKSLPTEHGSTSASQVLAATAHTLPEQVDALARARAFAEPLLGSETLDTGENMLTHADAVADILKTIGHRSKDRPRLVVGFAAETENVVANAQKKLKSKAADWIVANDVSPETGIMGGDRNTVHIVTRDGVEHWSDMHKTDVAEKLMVRVAIHLGQQSADIA